MSLQIELVNKTSSNDVFAFVTGLALDNNNAWFLLQADGKTPFYPSNPPALQTPIETDCAIKLGAPGSTTTVVIPHIAGGRIYFSTDKPLVFMLNPGPALVEPSVTNPSDPNFNTDWGFCEFTFNNDQLYANISYVDFVSLPVALILTTQSDQTKQVLGMPANGLDTVVQGLEAQASKDQQGWDKLIVKGQDGKTLRVLSPNQGIVLNPSLFENYLEPFIEQVWQRFSGQDVKIDAPGFGALTGRVNGNDMVVDGQAFAKPSTRDVFNASSGCFVTGPDAKRNTVIPRLNAELNRTTMLSVDSIPSHPDGYYKTDITNHYARMVHSVNAEGRGYAHPYDDASPPGGPDQSGFVNDSAPKTLQVIIGGAN